MTVPTLSQAYPIVDEGGNPAGHFVQAWNNLRRQTALFTATTGGIVPLSGGGTVNYLRADGTWAPVAGGGGGTVTSVSVTTAAGVSGSVATATLTPAITITLGAITPTSVATTAQITSSSATLGSGYATGAGGAIAQATSRATGVTLSKPCGVITLFSTTTTAGQVTTFTVTNTIVAATDVVLIIMGTATGVYFAVVSKTAAGSFNVSLWSPAAVGVAEAPTINFAVHKAVNA
jgi:hypothetical protein